MTVLPVSLKIGLFKILITWSFKKRFNPQYPNIKNINKQGNQVRKHKNKPEINKPTPKYKLNGLAILLSYSTITNINAKQI